MTYHRFVLHRDVPDYLLIGWLALPSLEGTGHGIYSVHCVWLCGCRMTVPLPHDSSCAPGKVDVSPRQKGSISPIGHRTTEDDVT